MKSTNKTRNEPDFSTVTMTKGSLIGLMGLCIGVGILIGNFQANSIWKNSTQETSQTLEEIYTN